MIAHRPLALAALLIVAGCRQDMADQPAVRTYVPPPEEIGGIMLGRPPPGAVARDDDDTERPPATAELMARGQQRYRVFCLPCHGRRGDGDGPIVQAGFPPPPSYHTQRLRGATAQHLFDVATNGFGAMYGYGNRITPRDRWAIIAYVRALQLARTQTASTDFDKPAAGAADEH